MLDDEGLRFPSEEATKLLSSTPVQRKTANAGDFLRAKIHLLHNPTLFDQLTDPLVSMNLYGVKGEKRILEKGGLIHLGPYLFRVGDMGSEGRKDCRVELSYEKAPSPLGLKRVIPAPIQRLLRFRRSRKRVVS